MADERMKSDTTLAVGSRVRRKGTTEPVMVVHEFYKGRVIAVRPDGANGWIASVLNADEIEKAPADA